MLRGRNAADVSNLIGAGNPNAAAMPFISPEIASNPGLFPSPENLKRLEMLRNFDPAMRRALSRMWTEIKVRQGRTPRHPADARPARPEKETTVNPVFGIIDILYSIAPSRIYHQNKHLEVVFTIKQWRHAVMPSVDFAVSPSVTQHRDFVGHATEEDQAGNFGFLILNNAGVIFKCSHSAARILRTNVSDLQGLPIWSLLSDIPLSNTSSSFNTRYLAHLSHTGKWRRFHAIGALGRLFPVELAISNIGAEGSSLFLIHLRQAAGV